MLNKIFVAVLVSCAGMLPVSAGSDSPAPTRLPGLEYTADFFPGATYDPSVPTPESILGFPVGEKAATPAQIVACLQAWDKASPRTRLVEYARSYENRPLYYMVISSAENMSRMDEIRKGMDRLADPADLPPGEADKLVRTIPPVAWLAYSIHGNESSGSDAALALAYHLTAATNPEAVRLLDDLVIVIDPSMNPDGRNRFIKQKNEDRGTAPNVDDQSLLHTGYWPWGRMNHYLFDLNRDWILGVNPETRGRLKAIGAWHPLLFVDAHEMGPQDTFLFSPPREPLNPNLPGGARRWVDVFARQVAAAFDKFGWPYYTGEWNEDWYPGYSDSWAEYRGAAGFLFEQARTAEDAVRLQQGTLRPYRESVHHQVVASMANLSALQENAVKVKRDFLEDRRGVLAEDGPYAHRVFAVTPTGNSSRLRRFARLMELQGFEIYQTQDDLTAPTALDQLGETRRKLVIPKGSILIPNRQPEARLVAAMLEFDPRLPAGSVAAERKELLKKGQSRIYDTTAWNITMLEGLKAFTLEEDLPPSAVRYTPSSKPAPGSPLPAADSVVAYAVSGGDDDSVSAAARLMERGVKVRVADMSFVVDGAAQPRGTVVVTRNDNSGFAGDLAAAVGETASELGLSVTAMSTGMGEGELPDLGGRHFRLLEPPRIALLSRGGVSPYDFGAIWHTLDTRLAIRHSHLDEQFLGTTDLRRYNLIVLPDRWTGALPASALSALKSWVESGGTLIAIGRSARALATKQAGLSKVRLLPDVLGKLDDYRIALYREWEARWNVVPPQEAIWTHLAGPKPDLPWPSEEVAPAPEEAELKKRDGWEKLFMPHGAFLAARVDAEHWLTFGTEEPLPILAGGDPVLMAGEGVEAPIRYGYLTPADGSGSTDTKKNGGAGWGGVPEGYEMHLRMSGLLWPEAADRLANAAWVTRESVGAGQVILFASSPVFRGAAFGTMRVLMNAMIYGPGLGASHPIRP